MAKMNEAELNNSDQVAILRVGMYLKMRAEGKLNDEFLPEAEGQIVASQLPRRWPPELRQKLQPFAPEWIKYDLEDAAASGWTPEGEATTC